MSIRAFESQAGITQGVLSNAIKKDSDIGSNNLSKIINTYDEFNAHWLLTGEGEMLKDDSQPSDARPVASQATTVNKTDYDFDYELPSTEEFDYINNDNNGKVPIVSELNFAISDPEDPSKIKADDYYYVKEFLWRPSIALVTS